MTGPGFMGGPPNQPQHPDFWLISDLILKMDGDATEGGRPVKDMVGEVVDNETLLYLIRQRILRIEMATHRTIPDRTQAQMGALYIEAFLLGAQFQTRKAER